MLVVIWNYAREPRFYKSDKDDDKDVEKDVDENKDLMKDNLV